MIRDLDREGGALAHPSHSLFSTSKSCVFSSNKCASSPLRAGPTHLFEISCQTSTLVFFQKTYHVAFPKDLVGISRTISLEGNTIRGRESSSEAEMVQMLLVEPSPADVLQGWRESVDPARKICLVSPPASRTLDR